MKSRAIICAIAAASLGLSSLSFAQGNGRNDRDRDRDHDGRPDVQQRDNNRRDDDRRGRTMGNRGDYRADQYYYNARGPEWRRGGHIPPQYRNQQYVVNDWRGHHLHAPPRGYHWVQVGGDYVLIAIATGIIAQLLLNQ